MSKDNRQDKYEKIHTWEYQRSTAKKNSERKNLDTGSTADYSTEMMKDIGL